jgi:hypothetical protein
MPTHMPTATHLDRHISALLNEWSARPFVWGVTDCCQFARAAAWRIHAIVVDTPAYISERDAVRTLARLGGLRGALRGAGLQPRPLASARRGDFVLFRHDGAGLFGEGLALVTGTHAHAPTRLGLIALDRSAWLECWGPVDASQGVVHA